METPMWPSRGCAFLWTAGCHKFKMFSYILLKYLIALASFWALVIISTSSWAPQNFLFPPTCSFFPLLCSMAHYLCTQHMHVYSVEEVWWKGFILPLYHPLPHREVDLPSTSSAHPIDYRLEQSLHLLVNCANIHKIVFPHFCIWYISTFGCSLTNLLIPPLLPIYPPGGASDPGGMWPWALVITPVLLRMGSLCHWTSSRQQQQVEDEA